MSRRPSVAGLFFYLIIVAIVYMLVRPGSNAAGALIAITNALAALIATAEGQPRKGKEPA